MSQLVNSISLQFKSLTVLLRGEASAMQGWIQHWRANQFLVSIVTIVIGSMAYGASMGLWRDGLQAAYTGAKFPLVIVLTTLGNGLLNGMLAPLLGLNISFRQSMLAILMSFAVASAILGSLSPVIAFLVWNTPPISDHATAGASHSFVLLTHVAAIAFAGVAGNWRLIQLLRSLSGSTATAWRIFFAWLVGNLILGSQISWILRPFIGSPLLPIEFLRSDAFRGSFFEAVFYALKKTIGF